MRPCKMPSHGTLLLSLTLASLLSNTLVMSGSTASTAGDVTSFGAVPNDGKDDTAAIQRALDACAKNGGRAFVPAGTYTISLPAHPKVIDTCLAVPSNCTLLGEGEASILKWDAAVNSENWWRMIGVDLDPGAKGDASVDNVTIRDLAIDGSTTHTVYPCFNATTGAELCEHNAGMFFYVHPPHVIRDVTVQRVLVEAVAGDCMTFADGVQGLLVEDVVVRDFLRQGVDLAGDALSRDFIVRNVTERPWQVVKQPGGSTIHIEEAGGLGNVLIENSVVNHSILAGGVNNLTIRGNLVHGALLGNGNTNLTVINNTVIALEGTPVLLSQGFTRTANISFNTLIAETVPGGRNLPYNTDTSHLYPTGISIWGGIHDPYSGMEKFTFCKCRPFSSVSCGANQAAFWRVTQTALNNATDPTSTNLTIHGNVFVGNLSGPNWNHHPQFHISAQAMTSFRAISLNGVDGAVVSGNTFEQGGNASENVCGCCTVVEADPATRCANVSILKTDDLDDATRSAAGGGASECR